MQFRPVGPAAVLVEVDDAEAALSLALWARSAEVPATEIVPGARSVLFDGLSAPADLAGLLAPWTPGADRAPGGLVELPVTYDGADLDFVAAAWRTTRPGVVARHGAIEFRAAFAGFAPGFAYLAGLPDSLAVPRLPSPRAAVPAGAVALADTWCGVYPTASPGGWRIIGRTAVVLWDQARPDPALLPPGTRVRFLPA